MTTSLFSHNEQHGLEIQDKDDIKIWIINPPSSAGFFLAHNLKIKLGYDAPDPRFRAFTFIEELLPERNIVSIVRNPKDWITSNITRILSNGTDKTLEELVQQEVADAKVALEAYVNFESDKVMFVKFEDAVLKTKATINAICTKFNMPTISEEFKRHSLNVPNTAMGGRRVYGSHAVKAEYSDVVLAMESADLTEINSLYDQLINRTETIA